jgi:hypothetical protein
MGNNFHPYHPTLVIQPSILVVDGYAMTPQTLADSLGFKLHFEVVSKERLIQGSILSAWNLHWELWNCGNNVPQVVGNPFAIVSQQFDMRANLTIGVISGAVYGSNQILCGNVFSNQWLVTEYRSGTVYGQNQIICGNV